MSQVDSSIWLEYTRCGWFIRSPLDSNQ